MDDAGGQARGELGQPVLDIAYDVQCVLAGTLQGDAGDDLAFPVHLGDAPPLVGGELDARDVAQTDRHARGRS